MDKASRQEPRWFRAVDRVSTALAVLGGLTCLVLAVNVIADVVARSLFGRPLPGTLDLTQFIWMPTLVALGFAYALLHGEHIRVALLTGGASHRVKRIVEVVAMAVTFVVAVALTYYTFERAMDAMSYSETAVGSAWLTIWPARFVVVVGFLALVAQALVEFFRALRGDIVTTVEEDAIQEAL